MAWVFALITFFFTPKRAVSITRSSAGDARFTITRIGHYFASPSPIPDTTGTIFQNQMAFHNLEKLSKKPRMLLTSWSQRRHVAVKDLVFDDLPWPILLGGLMASNGNKTYRMTWLASSTLLSALPFCWFRRLQDYGMQDKGGSRPEAVPRPGDRMGKPTRAQGDTDWE